jgi:hypothetical protein
MKTLKNIFGKSASVKNIADFSQFSLSISQMNLVKGGLGTEPILPNPGVPTPPPPVGNI